MWSHTLLFAEDKTSVIINYLLLQSRCVSDHPKVQTTDSWCVGKRAMNNQCDSDTMQINIYRERLIFTPANSLIICQNTVNIIGQKNGF